MQSLSPDFADEASHVEASPLSRRVAAVGRTVALAGVVVPLALIGVLKFTQFEIDALKPLVSGTPWLAWLYSVFGYAGTSYLLGTVELTTAALLVASPWSARAAMAGGALGALTFVTTISTLLALPIWEASEGGFPFLNSLGSFLVKDVALLGVSVVVMGEGMARTFGGRALDVRAR
jgi:uncharacterized membrane protein YkgB